MNKNNYLGIGIALGAGIGTSLGVVFNNIAIGIAIGVGIGTAIGLVLSQQASQKEDKTEQPFLKKANFEDLNPRNLPYVLNLE